MTIRTMTIQDYTGLYALWTSCSGMGLNDIDDSKEGICRFLARNPSTCFVAEENESEQIFMANTAREKSWENTA